MRESITALESAISELVQAKDVLPDELATKLDEIIAQARELMDSLQSRDEPGSGSSEEVR